MATSLSPKQLAEVVGVSESSLKRWVDQGRLSVSRTAGGHRRIPLAEAIRFVRAANLPVLKPAMLGLGELQAGRAGEAADPERLTGLLVEHLKRGEAEPVRGTLLELYLDGWSMARLCDGPLREAMHQVGDLWRHDRRGIHIEHRATQICLQTLHLLRSLIQPAGPSLETLPSRDEPAPTASDENQSERAPITAAGPPGDNGAGAAAERPIALGGAVSGDPYQLPSLMAACVLEEAGFTAINLGPDLPTAALLDAAREQQPRLVWLACSVRGTGLDAAAIRHLADQLAASGAALALGGRGFEALGPIRHAHVQPCTRMSELAAFARGLAR